MSSNPPTPQAVGQATPSGSVAPIDAASPTTSDEVPASKNGLNNMTIAKVLRNEPTDTSDKVSFVVPQRHNGSDLTESKDRSYPSRNQGGADTPDQIISQVPQSLPPMNNKQVDRTVVKPENLGETPDFVDCPHCRQRSKTKVEKTNSGQTNLAAAFCCLCCDVITVFIPLCFHWCSNIEHRCENCHRLVARQPYDGKMEAVGPSQPSVAMREESKQVPMSRTMVENMERPN